MKNYSIREATVEDYMVLYRKIPQHSSRAWVADYGGRVVCLVGVEFQPRGAFVFSDVVEDLDAPKLTIFRAAKEFMAKIEELNRPVTAVCDGTFFNSPKMLKMFGFKYVQNTDQGEVFTWGV